METRHFLYVLTILFFHIHIFPIPGTPKNKTKQDVTCPTAGWGLHLKYPCGRWSIRDLHKSSMSQYFKVIRMTMRYIPLGLNYDLSTNINRC